MTLYSCGRATFPCYTAVQQYKEASNVVLLYYTGGANLNCCSETQQTSTADHKTRWVGRIPVASDSPALQLSRKRYNNFERSCWCCCKKSGIVATAILCGVTGGVEINEHHTCIIIRRSSNEEDSLLPYKHILFILTNTTSRRILYLRRNDGYYIYDRCFARSAPCSVASWIHLHRLVV